MYKRDKHAQGHFSFYIIWLGHPRAKQKKNQPPPPSRPLYVDPSWLPASRHSSFDDSPFRDVYIAYRSSHPRCVQKKTWGWGRKGVVWQIDSVRATRVLFLRLRLDQSPLGSITKHVAFSPYYKISSRANHPPSSASPSLFHPLSKRRKNIISIIR